MSSAIEKRRKERIARAKALKQRVEASGKRLVPPPPKKRLAKKKSYNVVLIGLGAVFVLALAAFAASSPKKGPLPFGICKTFIELHVQFPKTLHYTYVEQFTANSVRVGYTHTDSFGQFHQEMVECSFMPHPQYGFALESILKNRKPLDQDIVDSFNVALPGLLKNPPDLTLPPGLGTDLMGLKSR